MASPEKGAETAATRAADGHLAERKARTGRWWRRGFAGFAVAVLAFAAGIAVLPLAPTVAAGLGLAGLAAGAVGVISGGIGTGSGISNVFSRA
jgi:hypothetical protein